MSQSKIPNYVHRSGHHLKHSFTPARILAVILILQALNGIIAIQAKPLFEHETDETGHLLMARYIATQGQLPGHADVNWSNETLQFTQPPLYYFLTSPLLRLVDDGNPIPGQPNPFASCNGYNTNLTNWARSQDFSIADSGAVRVGYMLRGLQLVFALATTYFTFKCARLLFPSTPEVASTASALIAFIPTLVSTTAFIGNDWPIMLIGAVALFVTLLTLKTPTTKRGVAGFVIVLALSLLAALSKVTGWAVFVLLLPVLGKLIFYTRLTRRIVFILVSVVLVVGALITGFNVVTYGSVIGRYPNTWLSLHLPVMDVLSATASEFWNSIVIRDQFDNNVVSGLARTGEVTLAIICISLILLIPKAISSKPLRRSLAIPLLLMVAGVSLIVIRNLTSVNILYIFAPFRYLGAGIPALAIISAAALSTLPGPLANISRTFIPAIWLVLSLLASTTSNMAVVQQSAFVPGNRLPSDAIPLDISTSEWQTSVAGYSIAPDDTFIDGTVNVTLYLVGNSNGSGALEMLELQADATSCRVVPARGFRPNISTGDGDWVAAHIELPYCGNEKEAAIPITLSRRTVSIDGRTTSPIADSSLRLITLPVTLVRSATTCLPNLGTINNLFQIIKFSYPQTNRISESFTPSVNWLVRSATQNSYFRTYLLTDVDGKEVARCEGIPRMGTYPTTEWREGEIVYDDSCAIQLPKATSAENLDLWIGMFTTPSHQYLPRELVHLGTITVAPQ